MSIQNIIVTVIWCMCVTVMCNCFLLNIYLKLMLQYGMFAAVCEQHRKYLLNSHMTKK